MAIDDGGDERLLAGEILIERADAHAGLLGDPVGAGAIEAFPDENASGCFDQCIDRRTRPLLRGFFSGIREWSARHLPRSECEYSMRAIARILHRQSEIATRS